MAASDTLSNDIIRTQQEAERKRNLERSHAATLKQQNQQPSMGRRAAGGAVKAAGSGVSMLGDAANAVPIVGGLAGAPLKALGGGLKKAGSAMGGDSVAGNAANDLAETMLPGTGGIRIAMDTNLPPLLRLMVAGKEMTKPSFMILWPLLGPMYCFFGVGTLLAWFINGTKADGEMATTQDIRMDTKDALTLTAALGVFLMSGLLIVALFGSSPT